MLVAALALVVGGTQAVIISSGLGTAGIAALEVPAGIAVSLFFTLWDTSIQEQVAAAAVSRVSSYDFAASLGLMPLGMAVAGPLADGVGLQATLVLMSGAGMLAALAWLAVPDVRRIRRGGPGDPPVVAAPVEPAPVATGRFEAEAGALVRDTARPALRARPGPGRRALGGATRRTHAFDLCRHMAANVERVAWAAPTRAQRPSSPPRRAAARPGTPRDASEADAPAIGARSARPDTGEARGDRG